ncbi:hypothetical protein ENSA5_69300 [Enhygromyxa salina]|uniref:Uncharacterized protein n=1 Tax=Enhygromyxa salina TaxID=215803 RepID=A0A2S9XAV5_9BACT|nr:hypothetical protein [Enhygromyxa salina]PRP89987.1 hypothetical protein ENSA5_69300 [Enhygromyxa salina]
MSMTSATRTALATSLLALSGCPHEPSATTAAEAPAVANRPEPEQPLCGTGERFTDYAWVPDDARLTTSIQRGDGELGPALTTLARMTEVPELALPVSAALDFRNLSLQLASLDHLLGELGLDPAELVELHSPGGELVWLWPSDCPPASLATRVLDRWQVIMRADLEHPGLRWGAGSAEGLPFDVLTLGEDRVGLAPLGRGAQVGAWLLEVPRGGDDGPGRALADIEAAPIRAVLSGEALLTHAGASTPADRPRDASARHRQIRVTGDAWDELGTNTNADTNTQTKTDT